MSWYDRHVLPRLVHWTCSAKPQMRQRRKVIPHATGRVLEIGLGSGLNLPFYEAERVKKLWGLEPSKEMRRLAERPIAESPIDVTLIDAYAEDIPLENDSVDTVVTTYTLCTIESLELAFTEIARVLRPTGTLVFCEHGAAPDRAVRRWQDWLDPLWSKLGGGCHLNRDIPALIGSGGFRVEDVKTMYLPGWRPGSFNYWGFARAR